MSINEFGLKFFGFQFWWGRILSTLGFAVGVWAVARIAKHLTGDRDAIQLVCDDVTLLYPVLVQVPPITVVPPRVVPSVATTDNASPSTSR